MGWFLYDNGLRHERVNSLEPMVLKVVIPVCRMEQTMSSLQTYGFGCA